MVWIVLLLLYSMIYKPGALIRAVLIFFIIMTLTVIFLGPFFL